jgi:large conductance mechanosensitive channel
MGQAGVLYKREFSQVAGALGAPVSCGHVFHSDRRSESAGYLLKRLPESARSPYLSAMSMVKEFKEFIARGNVVDLAVGVIIGAAFGAIVSSLVADIIMPPIGYLLSGIDFSSLKIQITPDVTDAAGKVTKAGVAIAYGNFINKVINFVIVAFVIFLVVKGVNSLKRKEAASPSVPPAPTPEEKLLAEIRDILAKRP